MFIVGLSDPPLVEHARQRVERRPRTRSPATSPRCGARCNRQTVENYLLQLATQREQVLRPPRSERSAERCSRVIFSRRRTTASPSNSSDAEAARVATLPGVTTVRRERVEHVLTDAGPQWIGASNCGTARSPALRRRKARASSSASSTRASIRRIRRSRRPTASGYTNVNPRGHFYGLCTTGEATCTPKLIGIYDMTDEGSNGVDTVGHGSHVSGHRRGQRDRRCAQRHDGVAVAQRVRRGAAREHHHVQGVHAERRHRHVQRIRYRRGDRSSGRRQRRRHQLFHRRRCGGSVSIARRYAERRVRIFPGAQPPASSSRRRRATKGRGRHRSTNPAMRRG